MRNNIKEIKIGIGLGDIKFGIYREDVKKLLGVPDDIETYSYSEEEEDLTESWHYDDLELSVGFDQVDDWRLATISITSDFYEFLGKKIFGLKMNEIEKFLNDNKISDVNTDDLSSAENPDYHLIYSELSGINFWFENGKLSEVQLSPIMKDEDNVDWPE